VGSEVTIFWNHIGTGSQANEKEQRGHRISYSRVHGEDKSRGVGCSVTVS
jgi:hypothetical protein